MSEKWTVCAVIKEDLDATLQFVAWYLDQGAARVHLFFDDPNDPAIEIVSQRPEVTFSRCTTDFWRNEVKVKPRAPFARRQIRALSYFYAKLEEGWLLVVDGDEFLWVQDAKLGDLLTDLPDDLHGLRILPAEIVQTESSTTNESFRLLMNEAQIQSVYEDDAEHFITRRGFVGHVEGKSFTRAGLQNVRHLPHWARFLDGGPLNERVIGEEQGAYLLHFIERGFDSWYAKMKWRLGASGFRDNVKDSILNVQASANPEAAMRQYYSVLHVANDERLKRMKDQGVLLQVDLKLQEISERYFPVGPSHSPAQE